MWRIVFITELTRLDLTTYKWMNQFTYSSSSLVHLQSSTSVNNVTQGFCASEDSRSITRVVFSSCRFSYRGNRRNHEKSLECFLLKRREYSITNYSGLDPQSKFLSCHAFCFDLKSTTPGRRIFQLIERDAQRISRWLFTCFEADQGVTPERSRVFR